MLATENLEDNRKSYCIPSKEATASVAASLSAKYSGATPTASAAAAEESECETEEASAISQAYVTASTQEWSAGWSAPASSAAAATASPAAESQVGEQYRAAQPSSSTTTQAAWTPAPTTQAPAPTTQAPAPTQQSSGGEVFDGGYATYYHQNGNPGACGNWNSDSAYIVAIDQAKWGGSFGQQSATCGRRVRITNKSNGKTVEAVVADVCPSCRNGNSLDLSVAAFQALSDLSVGMFEISYQFI